MELIVARAQASVRMCIEGTETPKAAPASAGRRPETHIGLNWGQYSVIQLPLHLDPRIWHVLLTACGWTEYSAHVDHPMTKNPHATQCAHKSQKVRMMTTRRSGPKDRFEYFFIQRWIFMRRTVLRSAKARSSGTIASNGMAASRSSSSHVPA